MTVSAAGRLGALLARLGIDWFLLGLLGAVALAYAFPELGSKASPLPWRSITTVGISLIFFFYGLRLSPDKLRAGMRNWRLHLLIQATTFLLFPILALAVRPLFGSSETSQLLWQSIFFLCTLPSTVSTSVVMVSMAGGNIPAAIFNATLSGLLGIVATPLWTGLVLHTATGSAALSGLALDLLVQVVLPVLAGVVLHRWLGAWAEQHRLRLRTSDQIIILLLVFTSFSESFAQGIFRSYGLMDVVLLAAGMLALFLVVFGNIGLICRAMLLPRPDQLTALFCGSKKSLVHGSVMAAILFPNMAATGALLLPLMLYHALQILAASVLAQRAARQGAII
ncbi:bile acid:sodium symporter family protein [Hymenobacter sp. BT730]|uniref:bile acid:sodium symporter family protein n=1 Tax=Hymenobacter sp. BT730 TaxID=3063332 RepID=UPI0026DFBE15|nr:bile acid:sodium symporter family protein [Hymenobacter sp. BT730]